MDKYQNKYRIPSARLETWDYSNNGSYFITICTKNRTHYFGDIVETRFIASQIGSLAQQYWLQIPQHFPFIELGNFVIMPNHIHGILIVDKMDGVGNVGLVGKGVVDNAVEMRFIASLIIDNGTVNNDSVDNRMVDSDTVETRLIASLPAFSPTETPPEIPRTGGFSGNKNPMIHDNISRIIRWYKGRCSFEIRKIHADFEWQPRFHDHIIRNSKSFETIQTYIANNPLNWKDDKFYS